jgi:hypothetical protein
MAVIFIFMRIMNIILFISIIEIVFETIKLDTNLVFP